MENEPEVKTETEVKIDNLKTSIYHVTELIASLSGSLRQLSLSALDLQSLCLTKKTQIEKAIDRADDLGEVIDQLIVFLEKLICCFVAREDISKYQCEHSD